MVTNKSWHADPRHQGKRCSLTIYLNNAHTGRRVHAELDRARHTRDLIVQMNQVGHAPVHQALVKHISPFDFSICFLFKGCCRQCIVTTCRAQLVPCWQKLIPYPSIKTHVCYLALPYCVLCYRVCTTHLVYVLQKSPCTIMNVDPVPYAGTGQSQSIYAAISNPCSSGHPAAAPRAGQP